MNNYIKQFNISFRGKVQQSARQTPGAVRPCRVTNSPALGAAELGREEKIKMKLSKEFITPDSQVAPPREFITESNDIQVLQRRAEVLAKAEGVLDIAWTEGDPSETDILFELPIKGEYRLTIRR